MHQPMSPIITSGDDQYRQTGLGGMELHVAVVADAKSIAPVGNQQTG
jgi:hypothetical protein